MINLIEEFLVWKVLRCKPGLPLWCVARDLVPFVQSKNRKKYKWRAVTFSKVKG